MIFLDDEDRGPGKCPHVQDIEALAILVVLSICISFLIIQWLSCLSKRLSFETCRYVLSQLLF